MAQNNTEILAAFLTIATTANPVQLNAAIVALEERYSDYLDRINVLADVEPSIVIATLKAQYPDIAKLLSSPLAPKVVSRIQEYLKKKGVSDGNQKADRVH